MSTYLYKAADSSGKVVNGSLEAEGEKGVVAELDDMGVYPHKDRPFQRWRQAS